MPPEAPPAPLSPTRPWVVCATLVAGATALASALDAHVSLTSLAMVYLLAVVAAAYLLDWVPAVATAVAAVTALNFFFVPPRWTLQVESTDHLIALGTLLAVSLVISHLARNLRREAALARLNEQRARQLQALATDLAAAQGPAQVQALGLQALQQAFAGPVWLALVGPDGTLALDEDSPVLERDGLRQCVRDNAVLGPGTGRWPGLNGWYLPVGDAGQVLGAALVQPAAAADAQGRAHATAVAALLGQALLRLRLRDAMQVAQDEVQRQQLLNTFLAAISHDLRTPLAAIVGAASTLLQTQGERLVPQTRARLLDSILSESSRLATLTENTLQLVRLSSQAAASHMAGSRLEEMVGAAVARVRAHDQSHRVSAKVEPGLPLVRADPVLMGQLLANLLDNALKYSKAPVQVSCAAATATRLLLCVKDRGAGIDPDLRATLFQPFSRGDGRRAAHGAGLGLALCRAIAQAHDGRLGVRARQGGGTAFCLSAAGARRSLMRGHPHEPARAAGGRRCACAPVHLARPWRWRASTC
jgi:two-component system sensor histidine kinase KdpD